MTDHASKMEAAADEYEREQPLAMYHDFPAILRAAAVRERMTGPIIAAAFKVYGCAEGSHEQGSAYSQLKAALADYCKATADKSRYEPNPEEKK